MRKKNNVKYRKHTGMICHYVKNTMCHDGFGKHYE